MEAKEELEEKEREEKLQERIVVEEVPRIISRFRCEEVRQAQRKEGK